MLIIIIIFKTFNTEIIKEGLHNIQYPYKYYYYDPHKLAYWISASLGYNNGL